MKIKIWSLLAVICMVMCASCSDDEPKTDQNGNDLNLTISNLTEQSWEGSYYYARRASYLVFDNAKASFKQRVGQVGTGELIVSGSGDKYTQYFFDFQIKGNKVVCKAVCPQTPEDWDNYYANPDKVKKDIDITFEYRDGYLYLTAPDCARVILGKGTPVHSDADGIIQNNPDPHYKMWVHENGKNVLDFRQPGSSFLYQLVEEDSSEYNFFDSGSITYNYIENSIAFSGTGSRMLWNVKEISDDKMVLQGYKDEHEDVYYAKTLDLTRPTPPWIIRDADWAVGGMIK